MRRPFRSTRTVGALLALAAGTVACSATPPADSAESTSTVESTALPTTTIPGPVADQSPPMGTFGLAYHGNQLWVADFYRGQVLAVDPDSGSIVKRLDSHDGVYADVNDIAISPKDGTIYWLGYNDGAVAILANNEYKTFGNVTPGAYSLALSADGKKLYAGGYVGRPGSLWTIELTHQDDPKPSEATVSIRSFDVGPDNRIFATRFGSATARPGASGALLQVDPITGAAIELVSDLDGPIAVKLSPDGSTAHVLSLPPGGKPSLESIDLATLTRKRPAIELRTPLADNLAIADDGRIFVSSYNDSVISVVSADGQVKTLHIGQPPLEPAH
jgi:sugar lactone lactonase YvrE